jgi:uncharacterized protein (DUF952 family)
MIIYHITRKNEIMNILDGEEYTGDTLKTEEFIQCSTLDQVIGVANQRFNGQTGLALLCIETDLAKTEIRYENLEGGKKLFPHIYGALNRDTIRKLVYRTPGEDGNFVLPVEVRGILIAKNFLATFLSFHRISYGIEKQARISLYPRKRTNQ